ncbi:uncharacterized protein V6R79_019475 [Siganus canaliculatus]
MVIPFPQLVKVDMYTVLFFAIVVWLPATPKLKVDGTTIRPHPSAFLVDVTESNPSEQSTEVLDQGFDKVLFCLTVDRDQVGSLRHTVQLCISPVLDFVVVWFPVIPKCKFDWTTIRPHPSAFPGDVIESSPSVRSSRIEVLDQVSDKTGLYAGASVPGCLRKTQHPEPDPTRRGAGS